MMQSENVCVVCHVPLTGGEKKRSSSCGHALCGRCGDLDAAHDVVRGIAVLAEEHRHNLCPHCAVDGMKFKQSPGSHCTENR